ncbi:MAG: collagen-like protein [Clostridium sp.]|nr:collagen-like protein [Clostridium sp.]
MKKLPTRSAILDQSIITSLWKTYYGDIRDYISQFLGGKEEATVIIDDGFISVDRAVMKVDTELLVSTGEVSNIDTSVLPDSQWIFLYSADSEKAITIKSGALGDGAVISTDGNDITLSTEYPVVLKRNDTGWVQVDLVGYARATDEEFNLGESDKFPTVKQLSPVVNMAVAAQLGVVIYGMKSIPGALECNSAEHDGNVYVDLYNELVAGTLPSTTYSDYQSRVSSSGFCDDFALDSTNKKFKCPYLTPIKFGNTDFKPYVGAFNAVSKSLVNIQAILDQCLVVQREINEKGDSISAYVEQSISNIVDAGNVAVANVETDQIIALDEIGIAKTNAVNDINTTKVNALSDISAKKIEITDEGEAQRNLVVSIGNNQISLIENKAEEIQNETKRIGRIWATGEDEEVDTIAPGQNEHSSRGYADLSMAIANTPEDVPVDTSTLLALEIFQGPKGDKGDQGLQGPQGEKGDKGNEGPYYTPSVSESGDLSWTNNGMLTNPATVNIKGPKGQNADGILVYNPEQSYSLNELVIVSGEDVKIYKSLVDNNTQPLTDTEAWEEISLGGGSAKIGDIGISLFVNESQNLRRILNGQLISSVQFSGFLNFLKDIRDTNPNLFTTETNWQAEVTNSKLGQCGKFVIDEEDGTIRLPKVVNINGLQDLALLGGIKAESLPNINDSVHSYVGIFDDDTEGALYADTKGTAVPNYQSGSKNYDLHIDASRSSSTYKDNAPVQQEAVQYLYFIQVATGTEESIDVTREIELNNPFSLFDIKWSDHELNNISWVRSDDFEWKEGSVYLAAYNEILSEYTSNDSLEQKDYYTPQFTTRGDINIDNQYFASNFTTSNYIVPNLGFFGGDQDWYIQTSFYTGNDVQSDQSIISTSVPYQHIGISVRNGAFRFESFTNGTTTNLFTLDTSAFVTTNTFYKLRCGYILSSKTYYLDLWDEEQQSWNRLKSVSNVGPISSIAGNFLVGVDQGGTVYQNAFLGKIDLKELTFQLSLSPSWTPYKNMVSYRRTPKGYKIAEGSQNSYIDKIYNDEGVSWYYMIDGTNQRFKLPRSKYNVVGIRNGAGDYVDESLPNLTGEVYCDAGVSGAQGVFQVLPNPYGGETTGAYSNRIGFDASLFSSTYQDNAPVQQRATEAYLYFYVGETVQDANLINAGRILEQFHNKANKDFSNLSSEAKKAMAHAAMPSDKYIDLSAGASGAVYVAPDDGYFSFGCRTSSTASWATLVNTVTGLSSQIHSSLGVGNGMEIFLPCSREDSVSIRYYSATPYQLRFIYANGSN